LHAGEHDPALHVPAAHTMPQAPQLVGLVKRFASQPSERMPLQFAKFVLHTMPQWPVVHTGDEFASSGHTVPHVPQFDASVDVFVHTAPHAVSGDAHDVAHTPPAHIVPAVHMWPHEPQFALSLAVFTQIPPQSTSPTAHVGAHTPAVQLVPAAHT
jgi:hypothetical protein